LGSVGLNTFDDNYVIAQIISPINRSFSCYKNWYFL